MSTIDSVYVFGGYPNHQHRVARFFEHKWTEVGQLLNGRYGHGSLTIGFETLLISGYASNNGLIEIWNVKNGTTREIGPKLTGYNGYKIAGLFAVPMGFCNTEE